MLQNKSHIRNVRCILAVIVFMINHQVFYGQDDLVTSQYMQNQLMVNPAYAGVRNSLSIHAMSRQQWLGIEGAPSTYALSVHSPLNKRMASLGGSILNYQSGPLMHNQLSFVYSYLLKINYQMFISLGVSAGAHHHSVGLSSLTVIDNNDPSFVGEASNNFSPNFGVGTFLYSPDFYLGVSVPQLLNSEFKDDSGGIIYQQFRTLYLSSGYSIGIGKDVYIKPSIMSRIRQEVSSSHDVNLQFLYKNMFWLGASYRINTAAAALLNVQVSKNLAVCYSYDFPLGSNNVGFGSHEISLTIDSNKFLRRNRHRMFGKKKVKKEQDDEGMRSIRQF